METSKSESDEDRYMPTYLLNTKNLAIDHKNIKTTEIGEFYNERKVCVKDLGKQTPSLMCDLSEKSSFSKHRSTSANSVNGNVVFSKEMLSPEKSSPLVRGRVLSIPPGPRSSAIPVSVAQGSTHRHPLQRNIYHHRTIHIPQMHSTMYHPFQIPLHPVIQLPVRPTVYSPRPHPYAHPGMLPLPHHQVYPPPMRMYPAYSHVQGTQYRRGPLIVPPMYSSMFPLSLVASSVRAPTSFPIPPPLHAGMLVVPHAVSAMPIPGVAEGHKPEPETSPFSRKQTDYECSPEVKKQLKTESQARAKEEREIEKASLRAKKDAEKTELRMKKKTMKKEADRHNKKFCNFAKDMFIIRLKDVDSFDRNNEVWRIDNHVLIQKFCGVPSLCSPARQFQSTNKMAGYDSRAAWRFFIIDSKHVEVDSYGSEITIHEFPSIATLREAKELAEIKDEEFKEVEKGELEEKLNQFEAKQISKTAEKLKRRIERKQKRSGNRGLWSSIEPMSSETAFDILDEDICRNIMNGLLDALEDEDYDDEDIFTTSDEELSYSDEDDAGSLHTLAHSSDTEDEIISVDYSNPQFELYAEDEVPEVALELTID